jgi:hypothetical protein
MGQVREGEGTSQSRTTYRSHDADDLAELHNREEEDDEAGGLLAIESRGWR